MHLSTKTRIVLIFLIGILFSEVFIGLVVNSVVANRVIHETQERTREALNAARWVYSSKRDNIDRAIRLTAIRYILMEALQKKNGLSIRPDMEHLMKTEGFDFVTLVDRKGTVLMRFHNPRNSGDSLAKDPFIKEAFKKNGISGTQVLSKEELLMEGEAIAKKAASLYVGILESKYAVLKEKLILLFMLGMLVAIAISSLLSFGIIRKEFRQETKRQSISDSHL